MNCRFTAIGARNSSLTRALISLHSFTRVALCNDMSVALHHRPGEGVGESQ
jgi:hypothetical protein